MEENRLLPMKEGYDEKVFKEIYQKTSGLRKKLASEIDCSRFGVDYYEILSWFDVKFLFVFNKYYGEMDAERLKGYIINSLRTYKYRILKVAYQDRYANSPIEVGDLEKYENVEEERDEGKEVKLLLIYSYMKENLSADAYTVFDIQMNPPRFIQNLLKEKGKKDLTKVPSKFIADYMGLGNSIKAITYVNQLRREIKEAIALAKEELSKIDEDNYPAISSQNAQELSMKYQG